MAQFKILTSAINSPRSLLLRNFLQSSQPHKSTFATKDAPAQTGPNSTKWDSARPFTEIPTEKKLKMLRKFFPGGKYHKMDVIELMFSIKPEYGNLFKWPAMLGRVHFLVASSPNDFEVVYRNEGIWPSRPGVDAFSYHREVHSADFFQGTEGLVTTNGEKWGAFRSKVNPVMLKPQNVKLYLQKLSEINLEFVNSIKEIRDSKTNEVPENFEEEINRFSLESISVVALDKQLGLLGKNRNNPEAKKLFAAVTDFFDLSFDLENKPSLWKYIRTPKFNRMMKALDDIRDITLSYVNEAVTRLDKESLSLAEKPEHELSVFEKLLKVDKKVAVVMAMDMLLAGIDTTASAITGILFCLAKNPQQQSKLREEIIKILPKPDSAFTEKSLSELPYLRACIKEAMRIFPVTVGNMRVVAKDVVLSGYRVPKGTRVLMVPMPLLTDDAYFPRPNEFLPERWLRADNKVGSKCPNDLRTSNPFVYLPFGFGPRICIGKRIVEMELELAVARIIRNFHLEFNHPMEKPFKGLLLNVPNIPLKFKFVDVKE